MKILIVFCHPRRASLTGAIADAFVEGAVAAGHEIEFADLYGENFDPRLGEADEPDWDDQRKVYSPEVRAEMARVERNDALVFAFPIWWWSMPAMLKGWIDRVWNQGWAYGDHKLAQSPALMLGLAATDEASYAKNGFDAAIVTQLCVGVLEYCGIADARLEMFYDTMSDDATRAIMIERARDLGSAFDRR